MSFKECNPIRGAIRKEWHLQRRSIGRRGRSIKNRRTRHGAFRVAIFIFRAFFILFLYRNSVITRRIVIRTVFPSMQSPPVFRITNVKTITIVYLFPATITIRAWTTGRTYLFPTPSVNLTETCKFRVQARRVPEQCARGGF